MEKYINPLRTCLDKSPMYANIFAQIVCFHKQFDGLCCCLTIVGNHQAFASYKDIGICVQL